MLDITAYPTGNVTFVFTDIENSTRMTSELGDARYRQHLRAPHRARLEAAMGRGFEIQCVGDGHMYVFQHAEDALAAVVKFQREIVTLPAYEGHTVKVRIGIHTAERQRQPHPLSNGLVEYPGEDTNYAARIGGLGKGGQIILSSETHGRATSIRELTLHYENEDLPLYSWPNRYLKSFEAGPQTVYEVLYAPNQLPEEPGSRFFPGFYIGEINRYIPRADKEAEVLGQFTTRRNDGTTARLVTILAEGGMGKTRLAVTCAVQMIGAFKAGAYFVSLALVAPTPQAVAEAIGRELGLSGEAALPDALFTHLSQRQILLILDNYESVIPNYDAPDSDEVAEYLCSLVTETPGVCLLATSRQPIGITDIEKLVSLDDGMTTAQGHNLFLARAALKWGDHPLTPAEETQLARILQLTSPFLDANSAPSNGSVIPLAIELTAAWVKLYSLEKIANGLEAVALGEMTQTRRGEIRADSKLTRKRHNSLENSLTWSYNLLGNTVGQNAQRTFAASSLFATSFDAASMSAVCGTNAQAALNDLISASLVRWNDKTSRYSLHRFTRQYATDRLAEWPSADEIRQRFVTHYVQLVADTANLNEATNRARLDHEWRNVIAATDVAIAQGNALAALQLEPICYFLSLRSFWAEWETLEKNVCAAAREFGDRLGEAHTLTNLGIIYQKQGHWGKSIIAHTQSLTIYREFGDRLGEGGTLNNLGIVYQNQKRWEESITAHTQSLTIHREFGDRLGEARTLTNLGIIYQHQAHWEEAIEVYNQSLTIKREFGDRLGEGLTLNNLGIIYQEQGRWEEAITTYTQSLAISREFGDRLGEARTLDNLSISYQEQGHWKQAITTYTQSLTIYCEFGDHLSLGRTLNNLGTVFQEQGHWEEAITTYTQSLTIYREFDDRWAEGGTLSNLGIIYQNQRRLEEAIEVYDRILVIFREFGDRLGEGQTLHNLGIIYQEQGHWEEAITTYTQSLTIFREFGNRLGEGQTLENIALLWEQQDHISEALPYARQAVEVLGAIETIGALDKAKKTLERLEWQSEW